MIWRQHEAISYLEINGVVVANVFPWAGYWAGALQGETMKTARHKFQIKKYCEDNAMRHYAKLTTKEHKDNGPEFEPDTYDIERRERAARKDKLTKPMIVIDF